MIGWAFAVALLVLVLAFEAVMFRHVAADYLADEAGVGPRDASAGSAGGDESRASGTDPDDESSAVECHSCGTANADVGTFTYCRACLARIR